MQNLCNSLVLCEGNGCAMPYFAENTVRPFRGCAGTTFAARHIIWNQSPKDNSPSANKTRDKLHLATNRNPPRNCASNPRTLRRFARVRTFSPTPLLENGRLHRPEAFKSRGKANSDRGHHGFARLGSIRFFNREKKPSQHTPGRKNKALRTSLQTMRNSAHRGSAMSVETARARTDSPCFHSSGRRTLLLALGTQRYRVLFC